MKTSKFAKQSSEKKEIVLDGPKIASDNKNL